MFRSKVNVKYSEKRLKKIRTFFKYRYLRAQMEFFNNFRCFGKLTFCSFMF